MFEDKMMNLYGLVAYKKTFPEAVEKFDKLVENIHTVTSENPEAHKPQVDKQAHTIAYEIAETQIECRFKFLGKHLVLIYGFVGVDEAGEKSFCETSRQYFNSGGCLLDKKGGNQLGFAMQVDEGLDHYFYSQIKNALEEYWRQQTK